MGVLTGLLHGFNQRAAASREESRLAQEQQDSREIAILQHLSTADNPEISAAALTGLLDIAAGTKAPKGGFLGRLMGPREATTHPAVANLLGMIRAGTDERIPGIPVSQFQMGAPATPSPDARPAQAEPPQVGAAAMPPPPNALGGGVNPAMLPNPSGQGAPPTIQVGQPPPAVPVANHPSTDLPMAGPPTMTPTGATTAGTTRHNPTWIFDTPAEKVLRGSRARAQGDVEGEVAGLIASGFSDQEARAIVKEKYARATRGGTGAPFQAVEGEVPGPNGTVIQTKATFNRVTGEYEDLAGNPLTDFRPKSVTASGGSMGVDREAISLADYGKRFVQLDQAQRKAVLAKEADMLQRESFSRGTGSALAAAQGPLAASARINLITRLQDDWRKVDEPLRGLQNVYRMMYTGLERYDADPIGAIELIRVPFAKIADNLSVVRESEFNRQTAGMSLFDRLWGAFEAQLKGGGNIPKPMLAEMVNTTAQLIKNMEGWNAGEADRIDRTAREGQIDPSLIRGGSIGVAAPTRGGGPPAVSAPAADGPPPTAGASAETLPKGTFVGNVYDGDVRTLPDGRTLGRLPDGTVVVLTKQNGRWYY